MLFLGLWFAAPNITFAQSSVSNVDKIAVHPQWLKLLHYKQSSKSGSYISSKTFFLSKHGRQDPLSELVATIKGFELPLGASPKQHAQCQFPARLLFLKKHLDTKFTAGLPQIQCKDYQTWQANTNASSISVIFASGYISNPASMFGHLFVKLNRSEDKSDLLSYSLNYGAIVPDSENPIAYIIKGILGGYDSAYSDKQFYRHQHNYGEVELRDMWEYELALSQADIDFLSAHIWELLQVRFDYFFIDENCAFHIAKLLELVLPSPIVSDESLWVVPSAVASGIANSTYLNGKLLSAVNYLPSSESKLNQQFKQLSTEQQDIAGLLIDQSYNFSQSANYQNLPIQQQSEIVEVLFKYQNVIEQKDPDTMLSTNTRRKLIRERFNLPEGKSLNEFYVSNKTAPHIAMPESKISAGALHNNQQHGFLTTGFRLNYFDDLSTNLNQTRFSNLEMLDIELITNGSKTKALKVDLIDIDSIYTDEIQWTKRNSLAWALRLGYEQLHNNCLNCGIYFAEGELGKSYLLNNSIVYAMIGAKTFAGIEDDLAVSAKIGIIAEISKYFEMKFEVKSLQGVIHGQSYDTRINAELNYHFAKNWEIRLFSQTAKATSVGIKLNYFWGY